jgi:hypothetical protein
MRFLAVNRVEGGHTKAPAPVAVASGPADDTDGDAE